MYRPSPFSPSFECVIDFTTNNPIALTNTYGTQGILPLDGGYVLFESLYGGNCVFRYDYCTEEDGVITLYCESSSWSTNGYYTDVSDPFTPYDGARGTLRRTFTASDWNDVWEHVNDVLNPHNVTKEQIGLGNVDNTSDADKPISTATQNALDLKADLVNGKIPDEQLPELSTLKLGTTATTAYYGDKGQTAYEHSQLKTGNPHEVTKEDVGLGEVDNTSDMDKPVSTAQQTAIDAVQTNLTTHIDNKDNPHEVDKADVGLGNVDNTSDADKPISSATQAALNLKADQASFDLVSSFVGYTPQTLIVSDPTLSAIGAVQDNLDDHISDKNNPHNVTKADVELGNVDNTSDADKPVSTAQAQAILEVQTNLSEHEANLSNPHGVTKAQVGLSNVDNTSDMNKPVSTAQQTALDNKVDKVLLDTNAVLTTSGTGEVVATSQESAFNKPFSDTTPIKSTFEGASGSGTYVARSDHAHPSETYIVSDVSIYTSDWVSDGTYSLYPYKASISVSESSSEYAAIVSFDIADAVSGLFSCVSETSDGYVSVFAKAIPEGTVIIPTIVFIKVTEQ